jgi:hypothetical protein
MIAFVGVATFDKSGTGTTSIHQAVTFSKPEAPVEERHTGSYYSYYASCAAARGDCICTRFSDCGNGLQNPPAHRSLSP